MAFADSKNRKREINKIWKTSRKKEIILSSGFSGFGISFSRENHVASFRCS